MRRSPRLINNTSKYFNKSTSINGNNIIKKEDIDSIKTLDIKKEYTDESIPIDIIPSIKKRRKQIEKIDIKIEQQEYNLNQELSNINDDDDNHIIKQEYIQPNNIVNDNKNHIIKQSLNNNSNNLDLKSQIDRNIFLNDRLIDLTIEEQSKLPKNFIQIYNSIKKMRSKIIAPVDTMGCAEIPLTLDTENCLTPLNYRFQLLISLMLSSQTKDEINYKSMITMKNYFQSIGFKEGISLLAIDSISVEKLDELIFSVGFHSRKAQYIKKSIKILKDSFNGDIPMTIEGLISLPGVGPKMAYLTLQKAWGIIEGIGVDVHVDRLSKQFNWVDSKFCKTPELTRLQLQSKIPKSIWDEINPILVGFGQSICLPKGRRCDLCLLSSSIPIKLCPNVDKNLLKRVESLDKDGLEKLNKTLRFKYINDIEDSV
ncbi:hypothetical protein WICMUC_000157 [Wickerhamomyces mucosus]|uniref:Endonuclease III homolog n=1 Tax=Wickerhamomyces mucosus TaxID=1378264 RepID=A0A9P8TJ70_9ASCO|nr:hypothetical protein WICMUC_000157 [Wickerhamomyces mucosus]